MIHPAKTPQPNGFDLATFAPSLDAEAGESLAAFLQNFEDPMPIGAGCHCKKHNLIYAEGGECYGCLQEERDELRAELVHSNKFLEDAKAAFKAKTDTLEARVADLERENKILTTQRDEYRECCSTLDTQGTKGVVEGWVCVPECEWAQAFRPLNLF